MFIAEDFIFIHFPKIRGTFVVNMLEQASDACYRLSTKLLFDKLVPYTNEAMGNMVVVSKYLMAGVRTEHC